MKKKQRDFLREAASTIMEEETIGDQVSDLMKNLSLSVIKITNGYNAVIKYERIFEGIPNYEKANLLAQFAMVGKAENELIAIFPGWNRGINNRHPKDFADALVLAERYKCVKKEDIQK